MRPWTCRILSPRWISSLEACENYLKNYYPPPASFVDQLVKNQLAMQETWVRFLGWEDALEKGKANHSSILAWRIPWAVESMGSQRAGHNWVTFTFPNPQNKQKSWRSQTNDISIFWGIGSSIDSLKVPGFWRVEKHCSFSTGEVGGLFHFSFRHLRNYTYVLRVTKHAD